MAKRQHQSPQTLADQMFADERDTSGERNGHLYSIRIKDAVWRFKNGRGSGQHFVFANDRDEALDKLKKRFRRNGLAFPDDVYAFEFERMHARDLAMFKDPKDR